MISQRDRIKLLQAALNAAGADPQLEVDGLWGEKSKHAEAVAVAPDVITPPDPVPDSTHHISQRGIDLVKHFEALYLKAYQDEVGIWTIGWGHTGLKHNDGTVYRGRTITEAEAEALLKYDMNVFERRVDRLVHVPLSDDEFSALVSFDFNTGGLEDSTLLRMLNAGDRTGAADQFLRWVKAGGVTLRGLVRRRKSERNLFLGEKDYIVYS